MAVGRKTGGRKKGTPNKVTKGIRELISQATEEYYNSVLFLNDIALLDPKDRVSIMEKLTNYVAPKMQSTTIDAVVQNRKTIEDKLEELSGDIEEE